MHVGTSEIGERFTQFAERECKDYSPLYYRLATDVSTHPGVLAFVAQQPDTQPNLLFAAVQFLTGPHRVPHSAAALFYLSVIRRLEFARVLSHLSLDRDIVWISNEGQGVVADLADRVPDDVSSQGVLGRALLKKGHRSDELLALAHPHGATLKWLAS